MRSGSEAIGPGADTVGLDGNAVETGAQFVPNLWELQDKVVRLRGDKMLRLWDQVLRL